MRDLLSKEELSSIIESDDSKFLKNIKLLSAIQYSKTDTAYDELIQILEELAPTTVQKLTGNKVSSGRNLLGSLINTFRSKNKYPLGMNSGLSSSLSTPSSQIQSASTTQSSYQSDSSTISPFKERHQATLISSESSSSSISQPNQGSNNITTDYRLQRTNPNGPPVTPMNKIRVGSLEGNRDSSMNNVINRSSQTPSRINELNLTRLVHNLSIPDEEQQQQVQQPRQFSETGGRQLESPQASEGGEPVISWHPYAQSPGSENAPRSISPHLCHTCYSSASSESGESSSESLIVDPNLILDSNVMTAIAREGPNMMSVKTATVCHNDPEEDYKMTSRPRGLCLIVNNINFEGDIFPTRKGSDEDANRFDLIFRQLGFETIMTRNLTADQMRAKFRELSSACKADHDALFVFILSHGSEHGIYGTDGMEVYLESEIISCFDNRNCKAMIGKPKVFVIQACRGRSKDCGGDGDTLDSIAWAPASTSPTIVRSLSQENRVPDTWLPTSQPSDGKRRKHPIRTDMLLVFSCLAGKLMAGNEPVCRCLAHKENGFQLVVAPRSPAMAPGMGAPSLMASDAHRAMSFFHRNRHTAHTCCERWRPCTPFLCVRNTIRGVPQSLCVRNTKTRHSDTFWAL